MLTWKIFDTSEVGIGEGGTAEVGIGEGGTNEFGTSEVGTSEVAIVYTKRRFKFFARTLEEYWEKLLVKHPDLADLEAEIRQALVILNPCNKPHI